MRKPKLGEQGGLQEDSGEVQGLLQAAPLGHVPPGAERSLWAGGGCFDISKSHCSLKLMGNCALSSALKWNLLMLLRSVLIGSFLFPEKKFTFALGPSWENDMQ